uniref:Receptor protein serine/threonine kinase n=1 Tax=Rhabditophanes sp. KR3021 TaxID=114890 RepID=A0AC35TXY7_9BILA
MLLIYIILVFSNLLLPSHAFGLLRVATLLPPHQKNNLLDNDWSALTNPTYSKSTSGEKNFDKDIAELPKGPVVNDWNLNHGPKIGKDDTDKCYCNYPEELCDGEDFCIKHRNAACFHSISEHVNAETQNIDTVHSYGCAPLESGSDASHFTCNAYRAIHSNPTSIVCCYEGSYCNFNITPPAPLRRQFIDINPPNILGALFDFDEHPIRAWLVTSLAIFIAFSFVVVCIGGASKVVKSIYLAQRNADIRKTSPLYLNCLDAKNTNVVVDNSLLIVPTNDYLEYSSGSGSQQACLNQRTIALDLEMDISVSKGRFGEVHRAKYRGSYVAVKTFYTTVEDSWKNEKEIYLTQMFNHENILQFIAADIGSVDSITKMLLITDYHDLGSLYDYLQNDNGICIREGLNLAVTSASGLEHLHRAIHGTGSRIKPEIAHRDIKSKNIIVKRQGVCCIADFGMAIKNDEYISQTVATIKIKVGTKRYMAPELLRESLNKYDFESFKQSDIYSFALVLWEIGQKINDTEFQINNTHSRLPMDSANKMVFNDDCNDPVEGTANAVSCNSMCFEMLIEDPDTKSAAITKTLVVRGCHEDITKSEANLRDMNMDADSRFCEWDQKYIKFDQTGNQQNVNFLASVCEKMDFCNKKYAVPASGAFPLTAAKSCLGSTINPKKNLKCWACDTIDSNCEANPCDGKKYCLKSYVKTKEQILVHKACTDVNPYFSDTYCPGTGSQYSLGGSVRVPSDMGSCYCNDKDYCNTGSNLLAPFKSVLIMLVLTFIFKSYLQQ